MNKNNNIDDFFQENFNNLEIAPPKMVWNNIERELKKKNNRKMIPIWWKFSSVAAILAIGIFIGTQFNGDFKEQQLENKEQLTNGKEQNENDKKQESNNEIVDNDNQKTTNENVNNQNLNNVVVSSEKKINSSQKVNLTQNAISVNQINQNQINVNTTNNNSNVLYSNNKIASNNLKSNKKEAQKQSETDNKMTINEIVINNPKIAQTDNFQEKTKIENDISTENKSAKTEIASPIEIIDKKPSLIIAEQEKQNLIAEKNKKIAFKSNLVNKWQIAPNFAPMYFNSTSNNSPIDSKLDDNNKSYDKNISLGVAVNYAINKKITIRSGINKFDMGYNTNNIGYYQTNNTVQNSINVPTETNTDITVQPNSTIEPIGTSSMIPTQKNEGTLSQKTAYLEVPLEVSYAVLNKKWSVNVIAGFSTLFLNKNQVLITSNTDNIDLGAATNLNNIHYSGNIGLGFNYKFMKSFQLNFEPMLKYQFNTFSTEVGNYKPYFVGLYSGVSYLF